MEDNITENTSKDSKANKPEIDKVVKTFGLSNIAIKNRTTVIILTILITLMGAMAYVSMPKESFPEIVMAEIYVGTSYPGNSPVDMENLITRPLENEINTITGVDEITSTSIQDYSTIIVSFEANVKTEEALQDVKDAVDRAQRELPRDLETDPNVFDVNMSEFPIMNVNLSGEYTNEELKEYAEYLEDKIEKLPEISKVDIRGLREREVKINVDIHKMSSLEISFRDVEDAVVAENVTMSGGNILVDDFRRTIRVIGEFRNVGELENVIVKSEDQEVVYLKDIATVVFDYADRESYARSNRETVVMLDVVKRSGENLINVAADIREIIADARESVLPEDLKISITNDQSVFTIEMVDNLENSIISGIILVVIVLLFFLGLRNALFVGIAIPLSMFISFIVLSYMGVTMNIMVLFSLILALGMLVDNGIVVVENIYRLMDKGYPPFKAAREGVGEVAWPIIMSTATTLAAFLPLALWPGLMGKFMFYLPLSLMIVLSSSLFVALVINPVLTSKFMKIDSGKKPNKKRFNVIAGILVAIGLIIGLVIALTPDQQLEKFNGAGAITFSNLLIVFGGIILLNVHVLTPATKRFQNRFIPRMERAYSKFLAYALNGLRPVAFIGGTVFMFFMSIGLVIQNEPETLFFPENMPAYVNIFIEKPIGTDIEETNEFTKFIEEEVFEVIEPYVGVVEAVIAQVGEGTSDPMEGPAEGVTPHKARITVSFVQFRDRGDVLTSDILDEIRSKLKGNAGVEITVDKDAAGPPQGKPISIEIVGDDFEVLIDLAEKMKQQIDESSIRGIEELKTNLQLGKPELIVDIDRTKARTFGVSSSRIATELRTALFGKEVSKFKQGEDDYPILLRLDDQYRYSIDALMNQKITFRDQATGKISQVPISALATATNSSSYGSVSRKDLDRSVNIFSNVLKDFNATKVNDKLKNLLEDFEMPEGYSFKFTGQQEAQAEEMSFLMGALMIAIALIFIIIVSLFNSFSTPFIILAAVLFSTIGVLLGLVVFQMDFIIIMTMLGIISLAGVVVNNAIVLLDYTGLTRKRRMKELELGDNEELPREELIKVIIQGGKTRLRPVLLTAITTILGLLPLAVGFNINYFSLFSSYDPQIFFGGDSVMFWSPLAWTVIFGLTAATFLTLVIVPVMYFAFDRLNRRIGLVLAKM